MVTTTTSSSGSERQQSFLSGTNSGVIHTGRPQSYDRPFQVSGDTIARATGTFHNEQENLYYGDMQVLGEQVNTTNCETVSLCHCVTVDV